jgi:hypothetical protein
MMPPKTIPKMIESGNMASLSYVQALSEVPGGAWSCDLSRTLSGLSASEDIVILITDGQKDL